MSDVSRTFLTYLGRGHSRFFLLRESWSSGIENFREFGIPEKSGIRICGNSVFPFGITEFSGFPNYWYARKFQKNFPKFFSKIFFFQNFQKKFIFFLVFLFSNTELSGFLNIFRIPEHFRYWAFLINSKLLHFLHFWIHIALHMQKE